MSEKRRKDNIKYCVGGSSLTQRVWWRGNEYRG